MKTQELDPFAIKSYSFALGKTNSFFSLTTVILSICVIGLSIGLTYDTVSHLWLPLNQLPQTIANIQAYPGPMSPTLVCYNLTDPSLNGTIPSYRIWTSMDRFVNFPYVTQENALKRFPNLKSIIGDRFGCIDFEGLKFTKDQPVIFLEVQVTQAYYYVQAATPQNIINNQPNTFIRNNAPSRKPTVISSGRTSYVNGLRMLGFNVDIYDSLLVNDEGKHYKYFSTKSKPSATGGFSISHQARKSAITPVFSTFCLIGLHKTSTVYGLSATSLTIIRKDIGFIIGAVLSWVSIFGLICGFIVGPIMDKAMSLIQAETLFHLPQSDRKPSVFKFMVASYKKGIFVKEDKYVKLVNELEKLKDVSCSLKVQKTLRRLCPKSSKLTQNQVIAAQHNFDEPQTDDFGIQTYSESGKYSAADFSKQQDAKDQGLLTKVRKGMFHWLDSGSDTVSINYSGSGHGSKQSVCVSFIFIVGLIAFLAIFGVLKFGSQQKVYITKDIEDNSYTFVAKQVVATSLLGLLTMTIVDGYGNKLRKLNITTGNDCLKYVSAGVQRFMRQIGDSSSTLTGTIFTCITEDYQLVASLDPSKIRSILVQNNFQFDTYRVYHMQIDNKSQIADMFTSAAWSNKISGTYIQTMFTIVNTVQDGNNIFTGTQLGMMKNIYQPTTTKNGLYLGLNLNQIYKQKTNTDIFTIVQNVWGLATVAITVLLLKLTKYINLRQKQKTITPQKSEFRDNLCIFLSKINGLLAGRHKNELQKAKYYLKQPML